jgi:hypothetical protein
MPSGATSQRDADHLRKNRIRRGLEYLMVGTLPGGHDSETPSPVAYGWRDFSSVATRGGDLRAYCEGSRRADKAITVRGHRSNLIDGKNLNRDSSNLAPDSAGPRRLHLLSEATLQMQPHVSSEALDDIAR